MNLPTQPTPPLEVSPKLLVLYGPPKVGKTAILSALPGCLLVDTENGSDYVGAVKLKINSLLELDDLIKSIDSAKQPYRYVAIDTIDFIENWCEDDATSMYRRTAVGKNFTGKNVVGELAMGGGYYWLRESFKGYLAKLKKLAPHVILISHVRDKNLSLPNGKELSAQDVDLTGKIRNIVCSQADAIGIITRTAEGKLEISFVTRDTVMCGSRATYLAGKKFLFGNPASTKDWRQIYIDLPL